MAYRPQLDPQVVVSDGDMSGDITSAVTIIQKISYLSYSYVWAGTSPVGAVSVEVSNDYELSADGQTVINAGTWNTYPVALNGTFVTSIPVSGNTGNGYLEVNPAAYAIRTKYTFTSGTGTLNVTVTGKVF